MSDQDWDVVVIGAGNAAGCAALAAREHGASVVMLECAPEDEAGGNTRFTAGAMRVVYDGVDDLRALIPELGDDEVAKTDFGAYTEEQFFDDMFRLTGYRADADLVETLVRGSREALRWMRAKGIRFAPMYRRQAFEVDGRFRFWGGLTVEALGGGPGLVMKPDVLAAALFLDRLPAREHAGMAADLESAHQETDHGES